MNLLVNARDALAGAGRIRVDVRGETLEPGDRRLEGRPGGRYARLCIVDSGAGIAPDALPRIFEPYFTTKAGQGGVGLGLAAVYGTVQQHGGVIHVRSAPGQGATFEVLLPLAEAPVAQPAVGGAIVPAAGLRVLVVDDVVPVRDALAGLLAQDGYAVATASDGAEALARVRGGEHFDLVLSDVVMPGLDGGVLARELAALAPRLPVILMTGYAGPLVTGGGIRLDKPFSRDQLHAAIGEALGKRS